MQPDDGILRGYDKWKTTEPDDPYPRSHQNHPLPLEESLRRLRAILNATRRTFMIPIHLDEWKAFAETHPLWVEHKRTGSLDAAARLVAAFARHLNPILSNSGFGVLTKGGGTSGNVPGIGPCSVDCIKLSFSLFGVSANEDTGIVKLIAQTGATNAYLFWNAGGDGNGLPKRAGDNWGAPTYVNEGLPDPEPVPLPPPSTPTPPVENAYVAALNRNTAQLVTVAGLLEQVIQIAKEGVKVRL